MHILFCLLIENKFNENIVVFFPPVKIVRNKFDGHLFLENFIEKHSVYVGPNLKFYKILLTDDFFDCGSA